MMNRIRPQVLIAIVALAGIAVLSMLTGHAEVAVGACITGIVGITGDLLTPDTK